MNFDRRTFLGHTAAFCAGAPLLGCHIAAPSSRAARTRRDYFCTWETQRALWKGPTCERDNMNDEVLFGAQGWVNLFPAAREGLLVVLDDGWDVPYGAQNRDQGFAAFGSHIPDPKRFPSLTGTTTQKLITLRQRFEDRGWAGLGLWVAAQMQGEWYGHAFERARVTDDIKRRLTESAAAGIAYWKVDWGVHSADIWYREIMSELAKSYAPDLIVDHSKGFDNALNGVAHPYNKPLKNGVLELTGATCRLLDNPDFDGVRKSYTAMMAYADSFRSYDTVGPMTSATALERAVFELSCADATHSRCTINVEDEPLIGAALGLGIGVMRAANWPNPQCLECAPKQRRIAEITRCVRWRKWASVFGSDRNCPVVWSKATGEECWHYAQDSTWWSAVFNRTFRQVAPSIVARGLPLPQVKCPGGENPLVCASRSPDTNATAIASLPLLTIEKGRHTPLADVALEAELAPEKPLGVFGELASITMQDAAPRARIFARDLADGKSHDITPQCRRLNGRVTLPGRVLAQIGTEENPIGDPSSPGCIVYMA